MKSFVLAEKESTTVGRVFYGPYLRVLHQLFGMDGPFGIFPEPYKSIDSVVLLTVAIGYRPVLFCDIKAPAYLPVLSRRREAHSQIESRYHKVQSFITPRVPSISAFGKQMAFYNFVPDTDTVTLFPLETPFVNGDAPEEQWRYNVLEEEGAAQLRRLVDEVKEMCRDFH